MENHGKTWKNMEKTLTFMDLNTNVPLVCQKKIIQTSAPHRDAPGGHIQIFF